LLKTQLDTKFFAATDTKGRNMYVYTYIILSLPLRAKQKPDVRTYTKSRTLHQCSDLASGYLRVCELDIYGKSTVWMGIIMNVCYRMVPPSYKLVYKPN
jgi:hypothetical protein